MKYIFSVAILICSVILSGCIKNDNDLSVDSTNQIQSIHKKNPIGIAFSSGNITMVYRDQKSLMGSIVYSDQKNTIVLEGNGKGIIKPDGIYHIPGVYGNIILSGGSMIYDSLFSFSGISSGSERNYKRDYVWPDKGYREEIGFMNWETNESIELSTVSQLEFSVARPEIGNSLMGFCRRNSDSEPIRKGEFKNIRTEKIYILYQNNGLVDHQTMKICFERKNNFYELKVITINDRKDIIDSFTLL